MSLCRCVAESLMSLLSQSRMGPVRDVEGSQLAVEADARRARSRSAHVIPLPHARSPFSTSSFRTKPVVLSTPFPIIPTGQTSVLPGSVDSRSAELHRLLEAVRVAKAVQTSARLIRGMITKFLRALAKSRWGVSASLTDSARLLFSEMPIKFRASGFEATMTLHRRRQLDPARVRAAEIHFQNKAWSGSVVPSVAAPEATEVSAVTVPPEHERIFDRSLLVKLAPEFASVKKRAMQLTGCEWREYVTSQTLHDARNRASTQCPIDGDFFDVAYDDAILFTTMDTGAGGSFRDTVATKLEAPALAGLKDAFEESACPPLHIVAVGFGARLRHVSAPHRRRTGESVLPHAFDTVFDRSEDGKDRTKPISRSVIDCPAFFFPDPVRIPDGVSIARQQGTTSYMVPTELRGLLLAACASVPLDLPIGSDRPLPFSSDFLRLACARPTDTQDHGFSHLRENHWQLGDRLRLSDLNECRARAAGWLFSCPLLFGYWYRAGILSVISSDTSVWSEPDASKNQQLMLRVDGVMEALQTLADDEEARTVIVNRTARAYAMFGLTYVTEEDGPSREEILVASLIHVFDRQYTEYLAPACFSVTGDFPRLHRNRNMIFSVSNYGQHPHFEENSNGEEDRLFGVVGFNVPRFDAETSEVPSRVRTTAVLDTTDCSDWHAGRQVTPEHCAEFAPAVIKESVIHHGVSSGDVGHVRIALHQAFDRESEQQFYFTYLWNQDASLSSVAAACLLQPDWELRGFTKKACTDIKSHISRIPASPRRRIGKKKKYLRVAQSSAGTIPTCSPKASKKRRRVH